MRDSGTELEAAGLSVLCAGALLVDAQPAPSRQAIKKAKVLVCFTDNP